MIVLLAATVILKNLSDMEPRIYCSLQSLVVAYTSLLVTSSFSGVVKKWNLYLVLRMRLNII